MKIGIMQPYFLPYMGYFQLISAVDTFMVYDNIQFSKGWVNSNRYYAASGKVEKFSLQLKKDSDYLDIKDRFLADSWFQLERHKLVRKFKEIYRNAAGFKENFEFIADLLLLEEPNLFKFNYETLKATAEYLAIKTEFRVSSTIEADHSLKAQDRVLDICKTLKADVYINPPGGIELYDDPSFMDQQISLQFIKPVLSTYDQGGKPWEPGLSVLDVLLQNSKNQVIEMVGQYSTFKKSKS